MRTSIFEPTSTFKLQAKLLVVSEAQKIPALKTLVAKYTPDIAPAVLMQSWTAFIGIYRPPASNAALLDGDWLRADGGHMHIHNVKKHFAESVVIGINIAANTSKKLPSAKNLLDSH